MVTGQLGAGAVDPNIRDSYVQQWNFTLQKKLPANVLFDVGYVGTKGTNLSIGYDANRPIDTLVPKRHVANRGKPPSAARLRCCHYGESR